MSGELSRGGDVYADLKALTDYALDEQQRINGFEQGSPEQFSQAQLLLLEIQRRNPHRGRRVYVMGDEVSWVPALPPGVEADELDEAPEVPITTLGEAEGRSAGYGVTWVPEQKDDGTVKPRMVLCHMIDMGEVGKGLNERRNLVVETEIGHFAIENLAVCFLDDAEPVSPLKDVYNALRAVVYDQYFDLGEKLHAIYETLDQFDFDEWPEELQQEVISRLNAYELMEDSQVFATEYGLRVVADDELDVHPLGGLVQSSSHVFVATPYLDLRYAEDGACEAANIVGQGIGIAVNTSGVEGAPAPLILPLNQAIRLQSEATPEDSSLSP